MTLKNATFTKINESFSCINCGFLVPKSLRTCRDHCPRCLTSLHVDNNPGDRDANCGGILNPVSWSQSKKKGPMIHYVCKSCGAKKVNKFLTDDGPDSDEINALLKLASVTEIQ